MRHHEEKTEFETGAHRDTSEGKGRPSLISPVLVHRTGIHLEKGEEHYGADNWRKGMPFRRTADSLIRHINLWLAGDDEEDHLAAISCNTMFLMHFEALIKSGDLSESLDDRCKDWKKILPSILTSPSPDAKLKSEKENLRRELEVGDEVPVRKPVASYGLCYDCGCQMPDQRFAKCYKCYVKSNPFTQRKESIDES